MIRKLFRNDSKRLKITRHAVRTFIKFVCGAAPEQSQVIDLPDHHPHPLTFEIPNQISILAEREIREPDLGGSRRILGSSFAKLMDLTEGTKYSQRCFEILPERLESEEP